MCYKLVKLISYWNELEKFSWVKTKAKMKVEIDSYDWRASTAYYVYIEDSKNVKGSTHYRGNKQNSTFRVNAFRRKLLEQSRISDE